MGVVRTRISIIDQHGRNIESLAQQATRSFKWHVWAEYCDNVARGTTELQYIGTITPTTEDVAEFEILVGDLFAKNYKPPVFE